MDDYTPGVGGAGLPELTILIIYFLRRLTVM